MPSRFAINASAKKKNAKTFSLTFSCIYLPMSQKGSKFAPQFERMHKRSDSLAQQVEHNTFNVGVLGSSPKRITKEKFRHTTNPSLQSPPMKYLLEKTFF